VRFGHSRIRVYLARWGNVCLRWWFLLFVSFLLVWFCYFQWYFRLRARCPTDMLNIDLNCWFTKFLSPVLYLSALPVFPLFPCFWFSSNGHERFIVTTLWLPKSTLIFLPTTCICRYSRQIIEPVSQVFILSLTSRPWCSFFERFLFLLFIHQCSVGLFSNRNARYSSVFPQQIYLFPPVLKFAWPFFCLHRL